MTVMFRLYRLAANERNDLARENRTLRHELAVARDRHVSDGRRIDDLEHHLELMAHDNLDLERGIAELEKVNAALVHGIEWNDGMAR